VVISPFYDIEYNDGPAQNFTLGDTQSQVTVPSGQSYCSFVLLPLLTFAARAKCLLIGGPGRGKTASAILMGVLAGYSIREVRRAIQKGQPQMTISDLVGSPLPANLVNAKSLDDIGISWRRWLSMRVKIIDEYNRIHTRAASSLTVVGRCLNYTAARSWSSAETGRNGWSRPAITPNPYCTEFATMSPTAAACASVVAMNCCRQCAKTRSRNEFTFMPRASLST
jgi:hypothetical protein